MKARTKPATLGCLLFLIFGIFLFYKICVEPADVLFEEDKTVKPIESKYIEITEPANLWRYGFKKTWNVKKIPIGTKLKVISEHVWESPTIDLNVRYYQVKHQGLTGWISEHSCKVINALK